MASRNILIIVLALLLLAFSASADCNYNLIVREGINFGTQLQNSTVSDTFVINNTGNCSLSNVRVEPSADSEYLARVNSSSSFNLGAINASESRTLLASAFIPKDEADGNHSIGSINILSDQINLTSSMYVNIRGKLQLVSIDVTIEDEEDNNIDEEADGYEIEKKATLGDTIDFSIKVKNDYDTNDDVSINNVLVTVAIDKLDIEEESEEFDLSEQDTQTVDISFSIPDDADMKDYDVDITIKGKDDDGIKHELKRNFILVVKKDSNDLRITKFNLSENRIDCVRRIRIAAEVVNYGDGKERDVIYTISNSELGININEIAGKLSDDLDKDDSGFFKIYPITIGDSAKAGVYPLQMDAYRNTDDWEARKIVNLEVKDCINEATAEEPAAIEAEEPPAEAAVAENQTSAAAEGSEAVRASLLKAKAVATKETNLTENAGVIALVALGNLIALAAVVLFAVKFIIKGKKPSKKKEGAEEETGEKH